MATRQAEAKRLLAEAGYPKGLDVELVLRRGPLYERGALSRQDDLKKVGINITITLLDTAGFRERTQKGDFQAYTVLSAVTIDEPDLLRRRASRHHAHPRTAPGVRGWPKSATVAGTGAKEGKPWLADEPGGSGLQWLGVTPFWSAGLAGRNEPLAGQSRSLTEEGLARQQHCGPSKPARSALRSPWPRYDAVVL
jgi:ABC-type transport system substrate-binding protein